MTKVKFCKVSFLKLAIIVIATVFMFVNYGCSVNPATGERSFTGLLTSEDEKKIGAEEHPKLVRAFGGLYENKEIQTYVQSIGNLIKATSEMSEIPFRFVVLDSPVINAFALPGGYIHVTRGLLALANDEAELAGVLAHEIAHVTARHSAQRYSRDLVVSLGTTILGAVVGSRPIAELSNLAGSAYVQGYSREQEFQADMLGVRYLSRAGYDPNAMSSFLSTMGAENLLRLKIDGKDNENNHYNLFSSHPRTADRVDRTAKQARLKNKNARIRDRNIYLRKIDGLVWGDSAKQGYIRDGNFDHPYLKIHFTAPKGFTLKNSSSTVFGTHTSGAKMQFDGAKIINKNLSTADYMRIEWLPEIQLSNIESLIINSFDAATATGLLTIGGTWANARFVAIRWAENYVYRFLFINPNGKTPIMDNSFRDSAYTFRKLSNSEAIKLSPMRVRILEVKLGQEKQELAALMGIKNNKLEWFNVINGFSSNTKLKVGQMVKIISP